VPEQEIHAAVEELVPEIERRADEIARLRRLPADLVRSLRQAGAFRIALPREHGGPEMTPRAQTELIETLSRADASVGWCVMIGSDSPYWGAFLARDSAAEVFADPDAISAGLVMPAGRAVPHDGGFVVNGRWAFGSGCTHADVIVAGCLVLERDVPRLRADGNVDWRIVAAPAAAFEILDTWHTIGLAGSGSNDYTTTDLYVPEEHTFSLFDEPTRPEPLYRFPGMFVTNMPGVPLGIARRAIDLVRDSAAEKLVVPELVVMAELPRVQIAVARAETMLGAARAYVYDSLDRLWETVVDGDEISTPLRHALSLSRLHAFRTARDVTQLMCDTLGGSSIYRSNPLERLLRDIITINQHVVAQDRVLEMVGSSVLTGAELMPAL
jgi:alkylation response protein AidB-like acyl-CoA dehydrogenase